MRQPDVMENTRKQGRQSRKYDVHVFTQVRVKVCGVEGHDQMEAIKKAEQAVDFQGLFLSSNPGFGASETEWPNRKTRTSTWWMRSAMRNTGTPAGTNSLAARSCLISAEAEPGQPPPEGDEPQS